MTAGPTTKKRSGNGRFGCILFLFLLFFIGGFYSGVSVTKWALHGPTWIKNLFGLPAQPTSPAVSAPIGPTSGSPIGTPPPNTAPGQSQVPSPPFNSASQPPSGDSTPPPANGEPTPQPGPQQPPKTNDPSATPPNSNGGANTTPPSGDLTQQVQEYNRTLKLAQAALKNYQTASQEATKPGSSQTALDRENAAIDEIVANVQRAQNLYEAIQSDPTYAENYVERDLALPPGSLPKKMPELSVDKLRFIQKR